MCVVTAGHLSTCPRMLKAADALAEPYDVGVVSTRQTIWAADADAALTERRRWRWTCVDYQRASAPITYAWTGVRQRLARKSAAIARGSEALAARAYGRVHPELVDAIVAQRPDFIYAGTTGALAAAAEAADRLRVPYALDLEDFHPGEHPPLEGGLDHGLADRILRRVMSDAAFLTTSSAPMADAYAAEYGVRPQVIHNTFPLPPGAPAPVRRRDGALRCYWFSQTIGSGRGLEDFIRAAGAAAIECDLTLRGQPADGFLVRITALAKQVARRLRITHQPPARPDTMVDLCREHHVGLGLEQVDVRNHALALSNKVLTYPLAGLALLLTDTPGHREFADDVSGAALVRPGDVDAMAGVLRRYAESPLALNHARAGAWEAARRRWHWEHDHERGALLAGIKRAVGAAA